MQANTKNIMYLCIMFIIRQEKKEKKLSLFPKKSNAVEGRFEHVIPKIGGYTKDMIFEVYFCFV